MSDFSGETAIVTGGSAGIGKAIAKAFAEAGAQVAIFGRNAESGAAAAEEINAAVKKGSALFCRADVSDGEQVKEAVGKLLKQWGKVDLLVNNAGITRDLLLMRMEQKDWDDVMDINVKSCYNLCHALVRPMMKARKGKVVNISSVVGLIGNPGQTSYAASKAAVVGFTKALAKELAPRGICVNCVAPGFIETKMTEVLTEEQKEAIHKQIPLARMGTPQEVANAVLFLAGKDADYITGQVITVDGGMVM